jgi:hypothetical protein
MPVTIEQHEKRLDDPALCEQLPVRDYLDNVMVRTSGAFVAGYELRGVTSYFASDQERNRAKTMLEALLKAIPEQSMRVQIRYEVVEDLGDLLDRYRAGKKTEQPEVTVLDEARIENWQKKEAEGHYLRPLLHAYFIWDPRIHHQVAGKPIRQKLNLSLSAKSAMRRSEQEHKELLAEFESLLVGIEATMQAAELAPRRLTDNELFLEAKRALNPLEPDTRGHIPAEDFIEYRSARQQLANVSILDETEFHLNVGGILYSFISLKELPDATFPGAGCTRFSICGQCPGHDPGPDQGFENI